MSSGLWERPASLTFPNVYKKFFTTDSNGIETKYQVVDIPLERYDEACAFMIKHFVPYEPKLVSRNGKDDPVICADYYNMYMYGMKQKVSVACTRVGSEEFVAVNVLEVFGRNDPKPSFKPLSKTCADVIEAADYVKDGADLFNRHNVDYYLSGTGLAIDPQYRGRGIATEMIKARKSMLKFFNLKLTSTGFASIGAQRAAEKAGSVVDFEKSYEELAKIRPNWNFLGTDTKSYVQMSLTI